MWDLQHPPIGLHGLFSFNGSLYKNLFLILKAKHTHRILVARKSDGGEKKDTSRSFIITTFFMNLTWVITSKE
jgi:hypothetical protein